MATENPAQEMDAIVKEIDSVQADLANIKKNLTDNVKISDVPKLTEKLHTLKDQVVKIHSVEQDIESLVEPEAGGCGSGSCGSGGCASKAEAAPVPIQAKKDALLKKAQMGVPFLRTYEEHIKERAALGNGAGVVPKPLDAEQVRHLISELTDEIMFDEDKEKLVEILSTRVPPGVDEAAFEKATYLSKIALQHEKPTCSIDRKKAVELLGTMQGGYNVKTLVLLLSDSNEEIAKLAAKQLKNTLLVYESFDDVVKLWKEKNNAIAKSVIESWAKAEWFLSKPQVPEKMRIVVFKVSGETNTDDLSPAQDAWSRPDIPLHALAMLKNKRDGVEPEVDGEIGPLSQIKALQDANPGVPIAYVGDVVGTGSSRKSATNSVLWFSGNDIPYVPNIKSGGVCIGGKIAPIFYNTMEDSGAMPLEMDVSHMNMGDVVDIFPFEGKAVNVKSGEELAKFSVKTDVLFDEVRAGGRIPLVIGRGLTTKSRVALGQDGKVDDIFRLAPQPPPSDKGFSLAQKIVGKACGLPGVRPNSYCEPQMTTVGSQDTTGPMTRDEMKGLACLQFTADLVMQSFCHTAAYPKPVDAKNHRTLPTFMKDRGGVSLKPADGIIHSWLNRMLLPDTVGTGGDSHTRFPVGISFPAGSGLVAFAAATGIMPLDMPESVLVRFSGEMQPGVTLRDLVQAIPYTALKRGLLTLEKKGKKNIFNGRILEIEGLPHLTCEQAFELADASAERSAAGCTIKLSEESVKEYLTSNVTMLQWMVREGYGDPQTLKRRIAKMQEWLDKPDLMEADENADYAAVIDIDMSQITEPILALPNDPDASATLSDVAGRSIDEVFIGSCMTNIGHFRAAGKLLQKAKGVTKSKLWMAPPTKMDETKLREEGYYSIYAGAGARTEMPGCSLCMGNQARVADSATVVSTSTRNFPNRLGKGANVFLASPELAAVSALVGKIPTKEEYKEYMKELDSDKVKGEVYHYLNFNELPEYSA